MRALFSLTRRSLRRCRVALALGVALGALLGSGGFSPAPAAAADPTAAVHLIPPIGHTSDINDVAVTRDGKWIATCATDGTAHVWDRETGREVRSFTCDDQFAFGVAISPGGDTLYACTPKSLTAWSVSDGRRLWRDTAAVGYDIALSADGTHIAVSNNRGNNGCICDAQTGELLHTLDNGVATYAAAFSADGQHVLLGGEKGAALLWSVSGQPEGNFSGHTHDVFAVSFAPDGARVATGSRDGSLRIWDFASRRELRQIRVGGEHEWVRSAEWSPDGKTIAEYSDNSDKEGIHLWNPDTGAETGFTRLSSGSNRMCYLSDGTGLVVGLNSGVMTLFTPGLAVVRSFSGQSQDIQSLALSRDGRSLFVGLYPDTRLHDTDSIGVVQVDLQSGRLVRKFGGMSSGTLGLAVSPDGSRLITSGDQQSMGIFDTRTAKRLVNVDNYQGSNIGALSPDGKLLAYEDRRKEEERGEKGGWGCVSLFSATTGALVRTLTHPNMKDTDTGAAIGFSLDGMRVFLVTSKQRIHTWSVQTGELVKDTQKNDPNDEPAYYYDAAVQPGTTRVALGFNHPALYDALTGAELRHFTGEGITYYAFTPDGKRLVGGGYTNMYVWDTETGATLQQWHVPTMVRALAISADGGRVFYAGTDTVLRVVDATTGSELLTYLVLSGGDWLALAPSGRFDGSPGGINRVSFESGGKTFDVSQFAEQFLQTGLVAAALGAPTDAGADVPTPPAPIAQAVLSPPPTVRLLLPASAATTPTVEVTIEATEQAKGGVKAIRLYQNGRLIGGPAALRGIAIEAVSGATTTKKFTVALEPGANQLRAVAYSNTDLESKPAEQTITFKAAAVARPAMHVLAVGINAYKDATMNLAYARPDAEAIADLFDPAKTSKVGGSLFSTVTVNRLFDVNATGPAIVAGIDALAQSAKPEDVVFIYLAGHGETAEDNWYFLPAEMRQMAMTERVEQYGIPWSKIETAIGKIKARKIVLILDACKSGAIVNGVRGGVGEQQALAIMARAQGIHILTASNGQQYAGEVKALGHGILTYALLEGLNGKAAQTGDATVMISELMSYVDRRVPELSLKYRGEEQYPTPLARGQNFPVAARK